MEQRLTFHALRLKLFPPLLRVAVVGHAWQMTGDGDNRRRGVCYLSIFKKRMMRSAASTTNRKLRDRGRWGVSVACQSTDAASGPHAADETAYGAHVVVAVAHALRACSRRLSYAHAKQAQKQAIIAQEQRSTFTQLARGQRSEGNVP